MQLEQHELVQIRILCKMVLTKSTTVLEDYSYVRWQSWGVLIVTRNVRVGSGKVLPVRVGVFIGEGRN